MEIDLKETYMATMNAGTIHVWQEERKRFFIPNDSTFYENPNVKWRPDQKVCVRRLDRNWILVRGWRAKWQKDYPAYYAQILYRYFTINCGIWKNNFARIEILDGPHKGKRISVPV